MGFPEDHEIVSDGVFRFLLFFVFPVMQSQVPKLSYTMINSSTTIFQKIITPGITITEKIDLLFFVIFAVFCFLFMVIGKNKFTDPKIGMKDAQWLFYNAKKN